MIVRTFGSVFLAGFECSTQRRFDGTRLDMIEATRHFEFCESDYGFAKRHGMIAVRDGFRWHIIGANKGAYDWSSVRPMLRAARRQDVSVIWDLCHYGYPDWLDIWSEEFIHEFARYSAEAVRLIRRESGGAPLICPVNEISFWAWLGGKEGKINPFTFDRPHELKRHLVRAKLAAIAAAREADPETKVLCAEPLINIERDTDDDADRAAAAAYHQSQFEAVDLMLGRLEPELGGHSEAVDFIGMNFYPQNQWRLAKGFVPLGHHDFKPFSKLLEEVWERYRKPILIAETGCEGTARPAWIHYVCQEVRSALTAGIPILGICIYPITDYNGWDNGRACETGLFTAPNERGVRQVCQPFLEEIHRQQAIFDRLETGDQRQAANDKPGIALNGIIRHPLQKLRRFAMTIAQRQA